MADPQGKNRLQEFKYKGKDQDVSKIPYRKKNEKNSNCSSEIFFFFFFFVCSSSFALCSLSFITFKWLPNARFREKKKNTLWIALASMMMWLLLLLLLLLSTYFESHWFPQSRDKLFNGHCSLTLCIRRENKARQQEKKNNNVNIQLVYCL